MNRTALSVVGLAVGAVLIIALFNIYKPAVSHLSHDVFSKVRIGRMEAGNQTVVRPPSLIDFSNKNSDGSYSNTVWEWHPTNVQPNDALPSSAFRAQGMKKSKGYWDMTTTKASSPQYKMTDGSIPVGYNGWEAQAVQGSPFEKGGDARVYQTLNNQVEVASGFHA